MAAEHPPFENVFPIETWGFSIEIVSFRGGTSILTTFHPSLSVWSQGTDSAARWLGPTASCTTRKSGGGTPTTDQKRPEKYRAWVSFSSASQKWSQMSNWKYGRMWKDKGCNDKINKFASLNETYGMDFLRGFCSGTSDQQEYDFSLALDFSLLHWRGKLPYRVDQ